MGKVNYISPELTVIELRDNDLIVCSPETPMDRFTTDEDTNSNS